MSDKPHQHPLDTKVPLSLNKDERDTISVALRVGFPKKWRDADVAAAVRDSQSVFDRLGRWECPSPADAPAVYDVLLMIGSLARFYLNVRDPITRELIEDLIARLKRVLRSDAIVRAVMEDLEIVAAAETTVSKVRRTWARSGRRVNAQAAAAAAEKGVPHAAQG